MCNDKRRRVVYPIDSPEALAEKLSNHSWCCCNGFRLGKYLFLNDAFSEDGAQEFGVLIDDGGDVYRQLDSATISWMEADDVLAYVLSVSNGELDDAAYATLPKDRVQTPKERGRCRLCA